MLLLLLILLLLLAAAFRVDAGVNVAATIFAAAATIVAAPSLLLELV